MNTDSIFVNENMLWTIGISVLLASWIVYLLIRLQKEQKRTLETKKKFEEIEFQMDTIQLETIESRIDPHLLKNILNNSIARLPVLKVRIF